MSDDPASEGEEEPDYYEEQYPPADDKYKQLEDLLNAMETQRYPVWILKNWDLSQGLSSHISSRSQLSPSTMVSLS